MLTRAGASVDGLEDFGLDIGVAEEISLTEGLVAFDIVFGEQFAKDVIGVGVGGGALANEFVAALRIGASDIAWDGVDFLALV